jgi:hypothetical protein
LSYVYFAVYVFRNQMRRQRSPDWIVANILRI